MPGALGQVTKAIVAVNVVIYLVLNVLASSSPIFGDLTTNGRPIWEDFEIWRVLTGGFLHANLIHIGFNMYLLWQLGQQIGV